MELITPLFQWCNASNEQECLSVIQSSGISSGDFVKTLLEINGINDELIKAAELMGNIDLCHKLEEIPGLIIKFIANPISLCPYLQF